MICNNVELAARFGKGFSGILFKLVMIISQRLPKKLKEDFHGQCPGNKIRLMEDIHF